jgi:DNA-binding CsgD family transcriptional regulator
MERFGSMFCFAASSMKYDRHVAVILQILGPHLHKALMRIYDKERARNENILLSTREKEVLEWLKQGKSSWDMSVILGISERTVNFHVHNIMRKLNATNRPSIIAAAAGMGLLDFGW